MKNYKRVFNVYAAWDYTREIEDLNKMSEKGWQVVKCGVLSIKFKKNEAVRYRYQIDYNPKLEDKARYIETFREQGWEYVDSNFNGWHYFRKLYDPSVDSEEYEIYNDTESLKEMHKKWQVFAKRMLILLSLTAVLQAIFLSRDFSWSRVVITLVLAIEALVIARGTFVLRNPQRADGHKRQWNGMPVFFIILFVGMILALVLAFLQ